MHANAPLTPEGRLRLCQRIESGWPVTAAAESMNVSRQTAHKWWRRFCDGGEAGLVDRSSRPYSCPHQTPAAVERRIVALRQSRMLGPARLAGIVDAPASTIHRVLVRHGVNRLKWMDRTSGRVIRRIETTAGVANWSTSTSRNWLVSRPVVATGNSAGQQPREAPEWVTPIFTPPSTPTPGSPTQSSPAQKTPSTASRSWTVP